MEVELVMEGVDIAGEEPGLPLIDVVILDDVLEPPYTGGCVGVVVADTDGRGAV